MSYELFYVASSFCSSRDNDKLYLCIKICDMYTDRIRNLRQQPDRDVHNKYTYIYTKQ